MGQSQQKSPEITNRLRNFSDGKQEGPNPLLSQVYDEVHTPAACYLRHERRNHALPNTAFHQAYRKLTDPRPMNRQNRAHFFGIAAQAMRRISPVTVKSDWKLTKAELSREITK